MESDAQKSSETSQSEQIQKWCLVLDIKPWDDATDLEAMEARIRQIKRDGLLWGEEEGKVSIEHLTDEIEDLEDYVQSVDIASYNRLSLFSKVIDD